MKTKLYVFGLLAAPLIAQDERMINWGGFDTSGSATVGYRLTSFSGRREKFLELFNLQSGPRLLDFTFGGRAKEGTSVFADSFQFTASGLGGDPFPSGQLVVRKSKVYDLRVGYRQSYYYWDRDDNAVLPSAFRALTTNHDWGTVRRLGNVSLLLHATNRLKFRADYGRNSRDGMSFSTRTLEYFGSPSTWGSFLRDSPYYVEAPLRESTNRFAGGLDYTFRDWSFHYTMAYQSFDQSMNWNHVVSPQYSINVGSATSMREPLSSASWSESRNLRTPSSEFSYNGSIGDRVSLRGTVLYFRYRGPSSLDAAFAGVARTTGTNVGPYFIAQNSRAQLTEPNAVIDQGASIRLTDWWNFHADYRYNRFRQTGTAEVHSQRDATVFNGEVREEWNQDMQQLDLSFEFLASHGLIVRPGVRLVRRDTEARTDGVIDPRRTQLADTVSPLIGVVYSPSPKFSVRADVQSNTTGATYTRITPRTDVHTRIVVRYQPFRKLTIEDNIVTRGRNNMPNNFQSRIRSNGATVSWAWNERWSTYAGFSYDSFLAAADVIFIRGAEPRQTKWRDQTVNRVWQLGVNVKPATRFGVQFTGNFVRSTGAGEISLENAYFGPLTFPMATGSIYYDFPRLGRLAADLQRTYYTEEIVPANNFGANLLTLRWTRSF
jgi:hypothetical protein